MNAVTRQRLEEVHLLNEQCRRVGIDYDEFIIICKVLNKEKHLSLNFLSKANTTLRFLQEYFLARMKVLNLTTIQQLKDYDPHYLAKGFRYAVSKEEKVDPSIKSFVAYCNVEMDMFDLKDMEELSKDVVHKMQLDTKSTDSDYFTKVTAALPAYRVGNIPPRHNKVIDFFKSIVSDLNTFYHDRPNLSRAEQQCYPDARDEYSHDPETFAIEFYLRHNDTPFVLENLGDIVVIQQLGHYVICLSNGRVLHDSRQDTVYKQVRTLDNRTPWITERLALDVEEYIDLGTEEQPMPTEVVLTATAGIMAELILGYTVLDLTEELKAKHPTTGTLYEAPKRYVLCKGNSVISAHDTPNDALNEFASLVSVDYGEVIDMGSPKYAVFLSPSNNFILVDEKGTICLISPEMMEIETVMPKLITDSFNDEYIIASLTADYGTSDRAVLTSILNAGNIQLGHGKLPSESLYRLFALTPLIAVNATKI